MSGALSERGTSHSTLVSQPKIPVEFPIRNFIKFLRWDPLWKRANIRREIRSEIWSEIIAGRIPYGKLDKIPIRIPFSDRKFLLYYIVSYRNFGLGYLPVAMPLLLGSSTRAYVRFRTFGYSPFHLSSLVHLHNYKVRLGKIERSDFSHAAPFKLY